MISIEIICKFKNKDLKMEKKIIVYPNDILKHVSKDVEKFDINLHNLLDDIKDTLLGSDSVGLAAIQIGVPLNIVLIKDGDKIIEGINPVITDRRGEKTAPEGCQSVPNVIEMVRRSFQITVSYQDRGGNKIVDIVDDFMAKVWQHETDHLKGVLYIDKLSNSKRKIVLGKYKKRKKV